MLLHKGQRARCSDTKMEEGCFHVRTSIGHDDSPHFHPASPNRRFFHSMRQRINNRTDATSRWWKVDQPKEHQERTLTCNISPERTRVSLIQLQAQQSTLLLQTGRDWDTLAPLGRVTQAHPKLKYSPPGDRKKDVLILCSCQSSEGDTALRQDLSSQCWTKCM